MAKDKRDAVEVLETLDLEDIQAEIVALVNRLDALRVLEKAAKFFRDGKPLRKSPTAGKAKASNDADDDFRRRAFDYLSTEGPTALKVLAGEINVPWQKLQHVMKHEWFVRTGDNFWDIAK